METDKKFVDLVISGCDFSGTSTQIAGLIDYFQSIGKKVRDIRGTEVDAMFHTEALEDFNRLHLSFHEFIHDKSVHPFIIQDGINKVTRLSHGEKGGLNISSMIKNDVSEYINPDSADAWIMEEPTRRGAGQTVRTVELYRSKFGDKSNQASAAFAHQAYRSEEFLRFRKILRELGKVIVRSRSEESACYQIFDEETSPGGVSREVYLNLPGHKIAFGNPPSYIFVVCGPENWTPQEYLELKRQRTDGRVDDDYEVNAEYQVMVNQRYATNWINDLYKEACEAYGSQMPEIIRFNIYHSKEQIIQEMIEKLKSIMGK
jgi:hypothetical protein